MRLLTLILFITFLLGACSPPAVTQQTNEEDSDPVVIVYRPPT